MKWAAKTTGIIVLVLIVLNIFIGDDPLGQVTGWLSEPTGPDSTRLTDLLLAAAAIAFVGWALKYFMSSARSAFGKGGGSKAH